MTIWPTVRRWLGLESRLTLKDPAFAELFGFGRKTLAGPVVSEATAFSVSAFWDGVNQIAGDVAKLPLNLHKRRPVRGSDVFDDSPVHALMKWSPNPETRSMVFRRTLTQHALVYGNGYAEIVRDRLNRPRELWCLHPSRVRPFYDDEFGARQPGSPRRPLRYRIDGRTVLEPSDILHISGLSDDGVSGINMVGVAREALGLALASTQFASAFFGHGTRFGGVLSSDLPLSEEQKAEIREQIEALHAKADQAFRLLVLGAGFNYQAGGTAPNDAQMAEIRDQQVMEVARYLNMPLYKLKLNTPGAVSYASVEMASLDYYKGPILTWVTAWEEELGAKLIFPSERKRLFWKHNVNAFLRGDMKSRQDALGVMRDKGIINANQWLDFEDMNPQDGDQGDLYLVQGANVPLNRLNEIVDKQVAPPPPSPPPPQLAESGDEDEQLEALEAELDETRAQLATTRSTLETVTASSVDQAATVERLSAELEALSARARELEANAESAAKDIQDAQDTEIEAKAALEHARDVDATRAAEVERLHGEITRLTTMTATMEAVARHLDTQETEARTSDKARIAELEAALAARDKRQAAVEAEHRALIESVMTRMSAIDCERARKKRATPEKLSRWVSGYVSLNEDNYTEHLLPAVRAYLAWRDIQADPRVCAGQLARAHLEGFVSVVMRAANADPEDYQALLDKALRDWEADQPAVVVDQAARWEMAS